MGTGARSPPDTWPEGAHCSRAHDVGGNASLIQREGCVVPGAGRVAGWWGRAAGTGRFLRWAVGLPESPTTGASRLSGRGSCGVGAGWVVEFVVVDSAKSVEAADLLRGDEAAHVRVPVGQRRSRLRDGLDAVGAESVQRPRGSVERCALREEHGRIAVEVGAQSGCGAEVAGADGRLVGQHFRCIARVVVRSGEEDQPEGVRAGAVQIWQRRACMVIICR